MTPFIYEAQPSRVVFGPGSFASLADEVRRLGRRAIVLSTPEQRDLAERAARTLGDTAVGIFAGAVMHVPVEIAQEAREWARSLDADVCVAVGGGSTIGLGKAIALTSGLPIVAVPTTYAGSEMTSMWGMTQAGVKTTGRDPKVQPRVALYDPELTLTLPPALSGASGVNALAHCVEALYARDTNPIVQLMAEEGIRALAESLPAVVERPADIEARSTALYGAWLAGACLGTAGVALHHKLCHTLGGTFNLPHAETHTIVLPYAVAYNRPAVPDAMNRMARAMRSDDPAGTLHRLVQLIGAPTALKELGMPEAGIGRAVDLALENPYWNPQPITRDGLKALLSDAFWGRPPGRYDGAAAVPKK